MKDSLIFEWPGRHHLHLLLPVTIVLAALLHAGLFFVFSIIYPQSESAGPDPAQACFIPPGAADAPRLEALLRSSDPAVFAPGRGLDLPEPVPPVAYIPRYASDKPALDPLPPSSKPDFPRRAFAGPVPVRQGNAMPAVSPPSPTRLVSSDALSTRIPALPEGTVFLIPQGFDPEPAVFLVALRADGRVAHVFQQHSSGNALLDLKAASLLRGLQFAPDPSAGSWGFVTFQWGTDVHPMALP
ncbi:MAG: hypothetical protein WC076_10215 [Terrimicrobiaceae bacterium]|nr:hypothetical protein [Terrimicrobiaceae bacterium]